MFGQAVRAMLNALTQNSNSLPWVMFGGVIISSESKEHECIAHTSIEANYIVVILAMEVFISEYLSK